MKKRTLPVLAVVAALTSAAFVACGEEHTHDYKWDSNADAHWQICECGDKTAEEAHFDVKNNETGADGADELCDACGRNLHVHNYTWHSDGAGHWEECVCGDKHDSVAHTDVKNNDDPDVAEADGKCDVCGHSIHAVTFNVLGHGTAPDAQYVGDGGHAANPGDLADDDSWKFKGWYKDEDCSVAYDFAAEAVSDATTIYAKWEDDTTAGASKNYAHVLALSTENQQAAKLGESVYYKHTAAEAGRYTVALALGASANGTFTVDKAEGTFGLDCDAESVTVDLDEGETVHILYTYKGETAEDITVSPLVSPVTDEPLPADRFLAGEYIDEGNNYAIEFNRTAKQITYMEHTYTARYIGGKFDTLSFVRTVPGYGDEQYSIKYNANGSYTLTIKTTRGSSSVALSYVTPQPPVALSALFGYYEPASYTPGTTTPDDPDGPTPRPEAGHGSGSEGVSGLTGGITELYIYRSESTNSTSVRYKALNKDGGSAYSSLIDATYDTAKNRLSFGQYTITLNLNASNAIESITFGGNKYLRKSDAPAIPPAKLPLTDNSEYNGATTAIRTPYGSQILGATGNNGITVMDYDASTGKYTVAVNMGSTYATYKVSVSNDGLTVTLYNDEGTVDTLTKYVWNIHDLPALDDIPEAGATENIAADGFQKGLRLYRATESGYYSFTIPEGAEGWRRLNLNDYTDSEYVAKIQNGALVYLAEGELIAVYMQTPAAITVSIHCPDAPMGTSEDMPLVLENGMATVEITSTQTYYFSYTAPAAGDYLVYVVYSSDGTNYNTILYSVNGTEYGYNAGTWEWTDGMSIEYPYASITVSADNLTLGIQVDGSEYWDAITVYVSEIYTASATDLTLTGEPANNSWTVTTTAATGANYHIASTKGEIVTVTGSAAFAVEVQVGGTYEAVADNGVYTAAIPAGKDIYFRLVSDTQQTLTLSQTYAKGTEGYPLEVAISGGTGSLTIPGSAAEYDEFAEAYLTLAPGTYTISHTGDDYHDTQIYLNGEQTWASSITLNAGDVLWIRHNDVNDLEVTFNKLSEVFTDEQVGTYTGSCSLEWGDDTYNYDITLSFDKFGVGTYEIGGDGWGYYDIAITEGNTPGTYSFEYDDGSVTFTFENGELKVIDSDKSDGEEFTMSPKTGTADNPFVVTLDNGQATVQVAWNSELYISLPVGVYTIVDPSGNVTICHNGNPLNIGGGQVTVADGDEIVLDGGMWGGSVTITVVEE